MLMGSVCKSNPRFLFKKVTFRQTLSVACGIILIHSFWNGTTPDFIRHIAIAAWVLGMGTQGYSTSVITWKIWTTGIVNSKAGNSRSLTAYYKAVIAVVVHSGAIYTAVVLPLTVTYATGSSSTGSVLSDALDPIAVSIGVRLSFDFILKMADTAHTIQALVPAIIVILVNRNRNREFQTTVMSRAISHADAGDKGIDTQAVRGNIVFARPQESTIEYGTV